MAVPNYVSDEINKILDAAFVGVEIKDEEREIHFQTLLEYFDKHGSLPKISIEKNKATGREEK